MSFSSAMGEKMKIVNDCVCRYVVQTDGETVSFN